MVVLGRPGVGEELLHAAGFEDISRIELPFVWEFPDPDGFARALASTGPGYEAITNVGAREFHDAAVELAASRQRPGLPLRAPIAVVALVAHAPR